MLTLKLQLIMRSKNPREVANIFREYARKIHAKAEPSDPSFIPISVACGKVRYVLITFETLNMTDRICPQIEQWCEHHYPSFVEMITGSTGVNQSFNSSDPRTPAAEATLEREKTALTEKRRQEYLVKYQDKYSKLARTAAGELSAQELEELEKKQEIHRKKEQKEVIIFAGLLILGVCVLCVAITYGVLYLTEYMEASNEAARAASS